MASADPPPVRLSWVRDRGAEACPGVATLESAVSQRLGRDPFASDATRNVEVLVQRQDDQWSAHIFVREANAIVGEREIASAEPGCEALLESVALAIALSIDPDAVLEGHTHVVEPATEPTPEPAPQPLPQPQRPRHYQGRVSVQPILSVGLLPAPMPGLAIEGELAIAGGLAAALGLYALPEARTEEGGFGFSLSAVWLGLRYALLTTDLFVFSAGAQVQAGFIEAVTYELIPTTPGGRFWLAPAVELEGAFILDDWAVLVGARVLFPVTGYDFYIERTPRTLVFQELLPSLLFSVGVARRIF